MSSPPWLPVLLGVLLGTLGLVVPGPAQAREPSAERWTLLTTATNPTHLVNYAAMPVEQARERLRSADAAVLYDRARGYDEVPGEGLAMRSRRYLVTEEGYRLLPAPEGGWALWRVHGRRPDARDRLTPADAPVTRVLGLPVPSRWGRWEQLGDHDPLVVESGGVLYVLQHVDARIRDPFDPTRETVWASLATLATVPLDTFLDGPREDWRIVLTVGGRRRDEPRLLALPITADGALDTGRDGVLIRFGVVPGRVDAVGRQLGEALQASAVRLHWGDQDSLQARLDALPPPPRERYDEPGSAEDPLMLAPRSPRDPLGAGVEARTTLLGDLTLIDLGGGRPSHVVPRWGGVEVDAWLGRGWVGGVVRDDLAVAQAGVRLGRMRDTGATAIGVEVGTHLGGGFTTAYTPVAASAVLTSTRLAPQQIFGRPVEMTNAFRVGTVGFEYRNDIGLRTYAGRGWVVTPHASAGFRYAVREDRALLLLGLGVEGTWNRNWFRR